MLALARSVVALFDYVSLDHGTLNEVMARPAGFPIWLSVSGRTARCCSGAEPGDYRFVQPGVIFFRNLTRGLRASADAPPWRS